MIRKIITIDEKRCNGCGLCASACHEGAIGIVDGKAKLLREDYCDGLGDCLPACPVDAISFEEREAPAYNEAAVLAAKKAGKPMAAVEVPGQLQNWPVQIKLAPAGAPVFDGADLLIAADCTAFAYGNFHRDFINGRITLVGCPKLDGVNYAEKLGLSIFIEIADLLLRNLPKCEDDMFNLLSATSNLTVEQVRQLDLATFAEMVIEFVKKEEFGDFIKVVSKLFK